MYYLGEEKRSQQPNMCGYLVQRTMYGAAWLWCKSAVVGATVVGAPTVGSIVIGAIEVGVPSGVLYGAALV